MVATCDIDHFKQVNDRYGHPEGDRVLRHLAHRLSHGIRRTDLLFRWGGEEFLLLLPDCTLPQALLRLEAIRTDLRQHPAQLAGPSGPTAVSITLSCGVTVHRSGEPSPVLLRRVDSALYAAKREGRDRVICLEPEESAALQRTTSTGQDD